MIDTLIFVVALAAAADEPAARCAGIADDGCRLACYDAVYQQPDASREAVSAEVPSPAPAAKSEPPDAATDAETDFGLSGQQMGKRRAGGREAEKIRSLVVAIEPGGHGKPSFKLENGQRWIQTEATDRPAIKTGEYVEIRRASLGSFLASVPGSGRAAVRVRRLE